MKEYTLKYKIKGYGCIRVTAENEDDAMNEIDRVFGGDSPNHEENDWIDNDTLWDIEWTTTDVTSVEED